MAFACYFDFEAKEKSEEKMWNVRSNAGINWYIEEQWITHEEVSPIWERHLKDSEEVCWHQITMTPTKAGEYFAELTFMYQEKPNAQNLLTKRQMLSSSPVIDIALGEYLLNFSSDVSAHPILLRCVLNLFPLFHLTPVNPLALQSGDMTAIPVKTKEFAEKLLSDMKSLAEGGSLTDVVLLCDGSEIKAHKCILSARSSVFAELLETSNEENGQHELHISNVSANALKELVSYIYTGNADMENPSLVRDLYSAAHLYVLNELKATCATFLKTLMTDLQHVLDNYVVADIHNDEEIRSMAMDYITQNYCEIRNSEAWRSFSQMHARLALPILLNLLDREYNQEPQ